MLGNEIKKGFMLPIFFTLFMLPNLPNTRKIINKAILSVAYGFRWVDLTHPRPTDITCP
jgi:hypothetical protein